MKQEVTDDRVEITGERDLDAGPAVFTHIHVHDHLKGNLDPKRVDRAIKLSMNTYCSVTKMLEKSVEITHDFTIGD